MSIVTQVWNGKRRSATTIMVDLCSTSFVSEFLLSPALGPASLVFLFLHVFACHSLSPLCQTLTSRTVFTCPEAAAMVTRMAFFAALALVQLEGEDDVFVVAAELAHKALRLAQHTASYVRGTKFKQLFHPGSQITVAHSSEVIDGEEVKVLCQVTWQAVKQVQQLFSKATGLQEIFHVKQLHPQNPDSLQSFDLLVQASVDVAGVEQRVSGDLAQQVPGKVADIVLAEVPLPQHSGRNHRLGILMAALAEVTAEVFTVTQSLDIIWVNAGATASAAVVLFSHNYLPLGGWMNVEDDLRTGRSPLQVASDPNPQLVDVGVFTIIRRDWQRVRNGQQLLWSIVFWDQPVELRGCRKLHAFKLPE